VALGALCDLLIGFQRAFRFAGGASLGEDPRGHLKEVSTGLVTVLLRMVVCLYAEDRGLLPMESDLYASSYSLSRLHAQLKADRRRHGDAIDDRYGAFGRIISLFRALHDGVRAADGRLLPARKGSFFDPDAFPFLEGRRRGAAREPGETLDLPRVSDGVVLKVIEQLPYKGLEIEQIGGIYEGLMGFEVKEAKSVEARQAALARRASARQPWLIAKGSLYLEPGKERRRTGSHYTPRSLTQPIVATTLRPVLERLGPEARPEQILDLKICDPAMGSGAFLVEACRQLADRLVEAWRVTGTTPDLPQSEDPALHARRLIAQRCLYGVDKDPLAVDLARLSLWLLTSAKEHPFTFVDHALRHGDSLVGLSAEQIANLGLHVGADTPRETVRLLGDTAVATYFSEATGKARKKALETLASRVKEWLAQGTLDAELRGLFAGLRCGETHLPPLHWEIEFPEVFGRENPGFDCFVGNPPFKRGKSISSDLGDAYRDWLSTLHVDASSNADLVAHFFRRAFGALRAFGTSGFVATNTISQGDTRSAGLRWICLNGGVIYCATRRLRWPGQAAVIVSVVHVSRGAPPSPPLLDGRRAARISAYLFHRGGDDDPASLQQNKSRAFIGTVVLGMGFTFDDTNPEASSAETMRRLIEQDPKNRLKIVPYIGGEEVNRSPTHAPRRYIINFGAMTEEEARAWPDLLRIVEAKVRPARMAKKRAHYARYWWQFGEKVPDLYAAIQPMERVLVRSLTSKHHALAFVPTGMVLDQTLIVFALDDHGSFALLQSSAHEAWARFFGATMKDDPRYNVEDCFDKFPFPTRRIGRSTREVRGKKFYDFRAALMVRNNEGLTRTYNRFHDPDDRSADIKRLRELHAAMDRAVLDAYGWTDLQPAYDFRPQLDASIRYTWDEDTRDEVLARLLTLNRVMAAREAEDAARADAAARSSGATSSARACPRSSRTRSPGARLPPARAGTRSPSAAPGDLRPAIPGADPSPRARALSCRTGRRG
jgi:hypothetical protein